MWHIRTGMVIVAAAVAGLVPFASMAESGPPSRPGLAVAALATNQGCITQSSFSTEIGKPGNFEVVVLQGTKLVHYWHPNGETTLAWHRGQVISNAATGPGCIIQSHFGTEFRHRGNLEVVVQEGDHVTHYSHDSFKPGSPWVRGQSFGTGVSGGPAIIQSDFKSGKHGNFEVVVPEEKNLVHYWHDNSNTSLPWRRAQIITTAAASGGTIIQSDFKSGQHGNFEVLVQEGGRVAHYWLDNAGTDIKWHRGSTFASGVTGSPSLIQSSIGAGAGRHGNFEAAVRQGTRLVHWFKDNGPVPRDWAQAQDIVTDGAVNSAGSLIQSTLVTAGGFPGNFEVVVLLGQAGMPPDSRMEGGEMDFNLVHYFHRNDSPSGRWERGQTVTYRGHCHGNRSGQPGWRRPPSAA
jgi:hypothetical protein